MSGKKGGKRGKKLYCKGGGRIFEKIDPRREGETTLRGGG